MASGRSLHLSELLIPHLQNGDKCWPIGAYNKSSINACISGLPPSSLSAADFWHSFPMEHLLSASSAPVRSPTFRRSVVLIGSGGYRKWGLQPHLRLHFLGRRPRERQRAVSQSWTDVEKLKSGCPPSGGALADEEVPLTSRRASDPPTPNLDPAGPGGLPGPPPPAGSGRPCPHPSPPIPRPSRWQSSGYFQALPRRVPLRPCPQWPLPVTRPRGWLRPSLKDTGSREVPGLPPFLQSGGSCWFGLCR